MIRARLRALDLRLLAPMLLLVMMGLLTLFSAGRGTSQSNIWLKQGLWYLLGFSAIAYVGGLNPRNFFRLSPILYVLGLLALAAVFVIGKKIGGSQRWIVVGGLTFQPSELMKWLTLLLVAHRISMRPPEQINAMELLKISALVVFPMLLILKQPDLGMAISFLPILVLIPILKGLKARWVALGLVVMVVGGYAAWHKGLKPYQKQRILTLLNPGEDLQGEGYQINQSRIAIGAGGLLGQGFTAGSQTQLNFLPVKTTDFIFSVWAEERGFLGVLLALGLFGMLLTRILEIGRNARTLAESNFCVGAASILTLHLLVNVGMVVGILPNKGMVLPFFSAGGSSTLSYFMGLGLVMAVAHRSKVK